MRKNLLFLLFILNLFVINKLLSQTQNYFGSSGALNGNSWSTSATGPYTSAIVTNGGPIANFNTVITTNPILSADVLWAGINVTQNLTFSRTGGIIRNYNNAGNMIIDVSSGKTFDCSAMTFSGIAAAAQTKNGEGILVTQGGSFGGGYTLNSGTIVAKNTISMGGNVTPSSLTINGGTIAADVARNFSGKYSVITIGGDFTLGSSVSPAVATANLTFDAPTSLGSVTRAITIGGTGIYTLGGVIGGNAGLTVNATAAGILLFTNPANTYNGTTTINSTAELRLNPTSTSSIFASQIDLAGGKLSTTGIATGTNMVSSSTLKLSDNSTITLGTNVHSLTFSDSHSVSWTTDKLLTVTGWMGSKQSSGSAGRIYVGVGGLSITQLNQVYFKGFSAGAQILNTGELVPSTDLPPGPAYQHFIMYGQSLSVGYQSYPSLSVDNVPGNYMIGNQVWINNGNSNLSNFTPLVSNLCVLDANVALSRTNGRGECAITSMVNHLQKKINNSDNLISTSCGTGGKSIEELSKECQTTTLYNDYTTTISSGASVAKMTNSPITCPAIVWMQGEWNYTLPSTSTGLTVGSIPTGDKNTYKSLLLTLKNNMQTDVMSKYSQTEKPLFITYQVGAQYTRGKELAIGMAELEASNENEDIICAGPVYPVTDRGGHLDPNGYRWYGEMIAKAYYKTKVENHRFIPLQPKHISRTADANKIKIQFIVPKLPLVLDDKLVDKVPDYGFAVYNDNIKMVISSVTVDGDCVYLTCTGNLTGVVEVNYAGLNSGILNGQGNLRDNDDYEAFYNYIDLDKRNADNTYYYPRDAEETTLRPTFEPKDATGNIIYDKPYPLYNFCVAFYYKLDIGQQTYNVLFSNNTTSLVMNKSDKAFCQIYQKGDFLYVNNEELLISIQLFDLNGKMVRTYNGNNNRYNLNQLKKGVYFGKVNTYTSTKNFNVIIK